MEKSGRPPMSSAVMTSTMESADRLLWMELMSEERKPVTTTSSMVESSSSGASGSASWPAAESAVAAKANHATAARILARRQVA